MESTTVFTDTETTVIGVVIVVLLIALLILRTQGSKKMRK